MGHSVVQRAEGSSSKSSPSLPQCLYGHRRASSIPKSRITYREICKQARMIRSVESLARSKKGSTQQDDVSPPDHSIPGRDITGLIDTNCHRLSKDSV
ncbi:hypothetical protein EON64_21270 [archaeon]|nr:MAG: hypothetical protein EON64_21270 [archaeon]